jgi:WXG100 family type VII secretion target
MATYALNISNVQEIADEMGAIARYIQGLLEDLESGTAQSLAEWTSSARDSYNTAKAAWDKAAADMVTQACNAQGSLSSITNNYALAEYQGMGLWS